MVGSAFDPTIRPRAIGGIEGITDNLLDPGQEVYRKNYRWISAEAG